MSALRRAGRAMAGPLSIVAGVIVVLHRFLLGRTFPTQHELLGYWLPNFCFVGKTIASGHVPAWNPHVLGGMPVQADPQGGWMNLPAMLLFALLPCGTAFLFYLALAPMGAGLGIYWFLRGEGLSRPAATTAGLVAALSIAGSHDFALPWLSASLAWTAIALAAASRCMRASSWHGRAGWCALTAVAWGQLAAAHLRDGLLVGTAALGAYLLARAIRDHQRRGRTWGAAGLLALLLVLALPLVNLAFLLPYLVALPRTTLGLGYAAVDHLSRRLGSGPAFVLPRGRVTLQWPLGFATWPGLYLGAGALALSFAGWRSRRHRYLFAAFALFGAAGYLVSVNGLTDLFGSNLASASPLWSFYLHDRIGLGMGLPLAVAVLAGVGLEAWVSAGGLAERTLMIAPAVVVWAVLPWAVGGARTANLSFLAGGSVVAVVALWLVAVRPSLLVVVPAALVLELSAAGVIGTSPSVHVRGGLMAPADRVVDVAAYLRPGPIADALRRARAGGDVSRFVSTDPGRWSRGAYLSYDAPGYWGLLSTQRSMLFGLEEGQGFNPVQLVRFWEFTRAVEPKREWYSMSYFIRPSPVALDLRSHVLRGCLREGVSAG